MTKAKCIIKAFIVKINYFRDKNKRHVNEIDLNMLAFKSITRKLMKLFSASSACGGTLLFQKLIVEFGHNPPRNILREVDKRDFCWILLTGIQMLIRETRKGSSPEATGHNELLFVYFAPGWAQCKKKQPKKMLWARNIDVPFSFNRKKPQSYCVNSK